jgi:class 3 adenylate cyclase
MESSTKTRSSWLIMFIELAGFDAQSRRIDDIELADTIDAFYQRVANAITTAGGRTVKFIGDAALAVFPEKSADSGVRMLLELKPQIDRLMIERGWDCQMVAKADYGTAVAGEFGPDEDKRFDVIGRTVNSAASLTTSGITLSVEAFERLPADLQSRFAKDTPTTYRATA